MAATCMTRSTGNARSFFRRRKTLTAGGAAEQLERQIQASLRSGVQHVIVDLSEVELIDSAGMRALVRGHTSAQRLAARLTVVGPKRGCAGAEAASPNTRCCQICDTLSQAKASRFPLAP